MSHFLREFEEEPRTAIAQAKFQKAAKSLRWTMKWFNDWMPKATKKIRAPPPVTKAQVAKAHRLHKEELATEAKKKAAKAKADPEK